MYFDFRAKDAAGKDVQGVIDAPSLSAAEDILAQRQLIVVAITVRPRTSMLQTIQFFNRVKPKELVVFFRQLSTMSAATLPLVSALRILVKQTESARLKTIISEIADDVDGGARLSQAFGRHPEVFNDFYVNMVRSGETSGHLDDVLSYLADQREKDYDLMSRIRGAMVYPAFILSVMTVVGIAMMIFVVPRLTAVLIDRRGASLRHAAAHRHLAVYERLLVAAAGPRRRARGGPQIRSATSAGAAAVGLDEDQASHFRHALSARLSHPLHPFHDYAAQRRRAASPRPGNHRRCGRQRGVPRSDRAHREASAGRQSHRHRVYRQQRSARHGIAHAVGGRDDRTARADPGPADAILFAGNRQSGIQPRVPGGAAYHGRDGACGRHHGRSHHYADVQFGVVILGNCVENGIMWITSPRLSFATMPRAICIFPRMDVETV